MTIAGEVSLITLTRICSAASQLIPTNRKRSPATLLLNQVDSFGTAAAEWFCVLIASESENNKKKNK